jgi:hypothetical protein
VFGAEGEVEGREGYEGGMAIDERGWVNGSWRRWVCRPNCFFVAVRRAVVLSDGELVDVGRRDTIIKSRIYVLFYRER